MNREESKALRRRAAQRARLESQQGAAVWHNLCQKGVRTMLGAPGGAASARIAWQSLSDRQKRGPGNRKPPVGVPVYFKLNTPYWHAALSAGRGYIWSTDIVRRGRWDKVSISYLERRWNAEYLGWATVINGKQVWPND